LLLSRPYSKKEAGLYHNTAVVFDKTAALPVHIEMTYPMIRVYEKIIDPYDKGFKPIETLSRLRALVVCSLVPEAARLMACKELLIYPTAIGKIRKIIEEHQRQLAA
jgi:N-carbamoylputrescine amidase